MGLTWLLLAAPPAEVTSVLKSALSCHLPRACLWSPSDDISQPPKLQRLALGSRPLNFWQGFILPLSLSWGQVSLSLGPLITDPRILSGWLDYILDYTSNDCPYKMLKRIYILSGKTDSNPPDISLSPDCPTNNLAMWSLPPLLVLDSISEILCIFRALPLRFSVELSGNKSPPAGGARLLGSQPAACYCYFTGAGWRLPACKGLPLHPPWSIKISAYHFLKK